MLQCVHSRSEHKCYKFVFVNAGRDWKLETGKWKIRSGKRRDFLFWQIFRYSLFQCKLAVGEACVAHQLSAPYLKPEPFVNWNGVASDAGFLWLQKWLIQSHDNWSTTLGAILYWGSFWCVRWSAQALQCSVGRFLFLWTLIICT